jgi:two-component system sensor histidine kinase KdpD
MPSDSDRRPDPEALLRQVEAEETSEHRGRLKIFLGYASRVGKSFRMFDEGRRRKQRGQDVIVGAVQSKRSPELDRLLGTLEVIPTLKVAIKGRDYEVLDVAAILKRHPEVCMVDELAYDNPPGSRNSKRWRDVRELIHNGITVVTAVNLQHIAEQQDAVEKITGKRVTQTVPEKFIRTADEIVLVDTPPEELRNRGAAPGMADTYRLSTLRELALLLAAEVVDGQLQRYLQSHGIEMLLGSQERILVCITPRSNARKMLESGRRNADRFHCDLLALYVEQSNLSKEDEAAVRSHIAFAKKSGAEVHYLPEQDSVPAIVEFARAHAVTQLFVGHSVPRGWREILSRNALDRLIQAAKGMDARIFPHTTPP